MSYSETVPLRPQTERPKGLRFGESLSYHVGPQGKVLHKILRDSPAAESASPPACVRLPRLPPALPASIRPLSRPLSEEISFPGRAMRKKGRKQVRRPRGKQDGPQYGGLRQRKTAASLLRETAVFALLFSAGTQAVSSSISSIKPVKTSRAEATVSFFVISTPAIFKRSIGSCEEPELRNLR